MIIDEETYLMHYGILRKSGRYPWGSGETQHERNTTFLDMEENLRKQGMSQVEIARGFGMTTTELRAVKTIAKNEVKASNQAQAQRLRANGYSNVAIGERMGINESSVRDLLSPSTAIKTSQLQTTANMLKDQVAKKTYIDIGVGVEQQLAISSTKLSSAVALLKEDGYEVHKIQVDQLGTSQKTTIKVLAPPGTTYRDVVTNKDKIQQIQSFSKDGGLTYDDIQPPRSIGSKRVAIRYAEQGGADADGVIYVRPGVKDISLGENRYAQVRIAVDGTHYLKGMAMYKDDLPAGVDLMFNTNKKNTGDKLDAMKPMKQDKDGNIDVKNPFGAALKRQLIDTHADGSKEVTSVMNIVNEEGDWDKWSKNLSSQMLSKQSPKLAQSQLAMTQERRQKELDSINALTNATVKKKLLEEYADATDAAAVHLKAAELPRQRSSVILPISSMKETEVYAPNFRNGEQVVLIRYPHGGIFEIPELTVNNRNPEAKKILGNAQDAIGIHSKVASKLSGADFDGDTVLVIPNDHKKIKTAPPLEGLKNFDPQSAYPAYEGMPRMSSRTKGIEMGRVSNLITDMTIQGATNAELARAVRHSMVVIDAEKHNLNYKESARANGISQLMLKYQKRSGGGASTIISRKKGTEDVAERKARSASEGGAIDPITGKKVFVETGVSFVTKDGKTIVKTSKVNRLANVDDAHALSSGTPIEAVYADHSNKLKSMANQARRTAVAIKTTPPLPSAKTAYAKEVVSLNAKLNIALQNAPLERQAQLVANAILTQKRQAYPDMDSATLKKVKGMALVEARNRTGAAKQRIEISDSEWNAIQARAISDNQLTKILNNANMERVRELATPKASVVMTSTKQQRATTMLASGYTQSEVADALGVSLSTLKASINE